MFNLKYLDQIHEKKPILIAGQTASGKSHLAIQIAEKHGGTIINADAIQVYANWRILTARPSAANEEIISHKLYGHVNGALEYSVGTWIKEIQEVLLSNSRPIIVGGTGLYFSALTKGLADIPQIPENVRLEVQNRIKKNGFKSLVEEIDEQTVQKIDVSNPMRVQRAWEVLKATGRGLSRWHDETPKPTLDIKKCEAILVEPEISVVNDRIYSRFDQMIEQGLLQEAENNLATWNTSNSSSKAIGAKELIAYLKNEISIDQLRNDIITATRQYAKRQRTWFRSNMKSWKKYFVNL